MEEPYDIVEEIEGPGVGGDDNRGGGDGDTERVATTAGPRVRQKEEVLVFTVGAPLAAVDESREGATLAAATPAVDARGVSSTLSFLPFLFFTAAVDVDDELLPQYVLRCR